MTAMVQGLDQRLPQLRNLIRFGRNAERGFTLAQEGLTNGELKTIFRQLAHQRARQAAELEAELERQAPGEPDDEASSEGTIPCAWTEIRSALNRSDEYGLIHKCDEEMELVMKTYEAAFETPLPRSTRALLEQHLRENKASRDLLKTLANGD